MSEAGRRTLTASLFAVVVALSVFGGVALGGDDITAWTCVAAGVTGVLAFVVVRRPGGQVGPGESWWKVRR